MNNKGQSVLETLFVYAIVLFLLVGLFAMLWNSIETQYQNQEIQVGQNALKTLSLEINNVYFLGDGSSKEIFITMPSMVDYNKSSIENKLLMLNVAGTDLFEQVSVNIEGNWPSTPGMSRLLLTSFGETIFLSTKQLYFSPGNISETLDTSITKDINIEIINSSINNYSFSLSDDLNDLINYNSQISINSNDTNYLNVEVSCSSQGSFFGKITFVSDTNFYYPVRILCLLDTEKLSITDTQKNITASTGTTTSTTFEICNNTNVDLNNLNYSMDGNASSYLKITLPNISSLACQDANLFAFAPSVSSTYFSTITVSKAAYEDTLDVNFYVS